MLALKSCFSLPILPDEGTSPMQRIAHLARMARTACLAAVGWSMALGLANGQEQVAQPPLSQFQINAQKRPFEFYKGDRIAIVGNTLADRMQHLGHGFEAQLQVNYPDYGIILRNLGFSGDELTQRIRSADFGSPDQWLSKVKASVVIAMFGYNESWAGPEGVEKFGKDLSTYVEHLRAEKFDGSHSPRLVLCSPTAFEAGEKRPDAQPINERLALYTEAIRKVAAAKNVVFVDLFTPTQGGFAQPGSPGAGTINGTHLNEKGYEVVSGILARTLLGDTASQGDNLKATRSAVAEKDWYWFQRHRVTDGYSIYGGRADLSFVGGQTNRVVMARELEVLEVMTANRDKVIHLAATGKQTTPDDSNTPDFIPVVTNKPGPLAGGKHIFLTGEKAIDKMTVAKGLKVNLFASEETWPELANPVQMAWDGQGRLWVAVWPTYPHWKPKEPMNDKILILEDTNADGKADKMTVFADNLHNPTGFDFYNGGVIVAQAPDLVFLKDTNGDGKADVRNRILHGLDSADTHHTSNSFVTDGGGAIYFQEGTFHHTQVESPYGPVRRCANGGVFRYEPRTQKFDVYVSFGFANPHGHVFDRWGQDIVVDGTGSNPYQASLFSSHLPYPEKHNRPPQVYQQRTRPCPGMEYLSSTSFPAEYQGNLIVGNVIGFQGLLRYKIFDKGGGLTGEELEPILSSTDPSFRPSDLKMGPDGSIYFIDWQNPIVGHMQHNLRDPSRDREHGRIYRVTHTDGQPQKFPRMDTESIPGLLALLQNPIDLIRMAARKELGARPTAEVIAAAAPWAAALTDSHDLLEALWLYQSHDVVSEKVLGKALSCGDYRTRAAATRVIIAWRDRLPTTLDLLRGLAADPHPRVRLEAVRASSFLTGAEAIEVPLIAAGQADDPYVDFMRAEVMRVLEPAYKAALASGRKVDFKTDAAIRFQLRTLPSDLLLKEKRVPAVLEEIVLRGGVDDNTRMSSLADLSRNKNTSQAAMLLGLMANLGGKTGQESVVVDLARFLPGRPPQELAAVRPRIEELADKGSAPLVRQIGWLMLLAIDSGVDTTWARAARSNRAQRDLVAAIPLVRSEDARRALYPRLEALVAGAPNGDGAAKKPNGRFVRIELPGRQRTLTLAEVEVLSDGANIARKGSASQSSTSNSGDASKAIDGNTSGTFGDGGQTHSQEGQANPWWEVDLGGEFPIDAVIIHNRTDGNLGTRLANHTLRVLDGSRGIIFEKKALPSPERMARVEVGGESPARLLRNEAMLALTTIPGKEKEAGKLLASRMEDTDDRLPATRALLRLPARSVDAAQSGILVKTALEALRAVPEKRRTSSPALEYIQLADTLASALPATEAAATRRTLGDLAVRVLRVGTLPERMAYDQETLVVQAGKPVEILFDNIDLMPHNLVILKPGSLEEVGMMAETTATSADAQARQFVPRSDKILLASRLLQTREGQQLAFTAPTQPGVYPYVCTYPGHWRRMYGALVVVADLSAWQADPENYLKKAALSVKDPLLADRRERKEWKFSDLSQAVAMLEPGRDFERGRKLFETASCIGCHKIGDKGNAFGPKLTEVDPKWTPTDLLRELLDPSLKIDPKYQSEILTLSNGKLVTGLTVAEDKNSVSLVENPLASIAPTVVQKAQIESREKSKVSLMPKGLLDKLSKEEILDLLAYVYAKGDRTHGLYRKAGH